MRNERCQLGFLLRERLAGHRGEGAERTPAHGTRKGRRSSDGQATHGQRALRTPLENLEGLTRRLRSRCQQGELAALDRGHGTPRSGSTPAADGKPATGERGRGPGREARGSRWRRRRRWTARLIDERW